MVCEFDETAEQSLRHEQETTIPIRHNMTIRKAFALQKSGLEKQDYMPRTAAAT